jgi:hypothetical protein
MTVARLMNLVVIACSHSASNYIGRKYSLLSVKSLLFSKNSDKAIAPLITARLSQTRIIGVEGFWEKRAYCEEALF